MYWFRWFSWKGRSYCSNQFCPWFNALDNYSVYQKIREGSLLPVVLQEVSLQHLMPRLQGYFLGLEVILREYGTRYFSSVVLSAVTATVISRTFLGSSPAFVTPPYELLSSYDIIFYFVLGLLAAVVGWLFIKVLYKCEDIFDAIKMPSYLKPALGGLLLGLIGLYFPQIFGVGYPSIEKTLNGQLGPFLVFGLIGLKIIATSLTLGSGGSGGVFAPSLFIGAMLGKFFWLIASSGIPRNLCFYWRLSPWLGWQLYLQEPPRLRYQQF